MRRRRRRSLALLVLGAVILLSGAATADETASAVEDVLARASAAQTEAAQDELAEELVALGIDANGALRVRRDDGAEIRVIAGDVTIVKEGA